MKKCFKCGVEKPRTDFYTHKQMGDGLLGKCKECTKKDAKQRFYEKIVDPKWKESEGKRHRKKYHRLYVGTGKANPKTIEKYKAKYPEKEKARLKSGCLVAPFDNLEKHHWSYNDEHFLDVIWITKKQHMKAHRFLIYDQEKKMYCRYDTKELLDTRDGHRDFIDDCIDYKDD